MVDTDDKVEFLTKYFQDMFAPAFFPYEVKVYSPAEIRNPFIGEEVQFTAKAGKTGNVPDTLLSITFITYCWHFQKGSQDC